MFLNRGALQLGLQLVQVKLGEAAEAPSFSSFNGETETGAQKERPLRELPTTSTQMKDRTAKIQVPKLVTTR